ncbi:hypothetical protein J6590_082131 [Homalodisca vitripennis]|nr:hypothetical protein J6590_082131 [Homalodisca vitripennis]
MIPLLGSGSRLKLSAANEVYEDDKEKRQTSARPAITDPPMEEVEETEAAASAHLCTQKLPPLSPSTSYIPIGDTEERQYSNVPANESQASMIPLMRSGSNLRLSAAIDVYEADKESSRQRFSRIRPNYAHRSYHTSAPTTSYMPIGDWKERQYSIVPAN